MDIILIVIFVLMIAGAIYALQARDLLSAVISYGIVGFGLVICFLFLKAPDLAIVQIVVEIITLIIMIAIILNTTRKVEKEKAPGSMIIYNILGLILIGTFIYFFIIATKGLPEFGKHFFRMADEYVKSGVRNTKSMNITTSVVLDFRAYDTLGEITILFTAVIGILAVLRAKGRKDG